MLELRMHGALRGRRFNTEGREDHEARGEIPDFKTTLRTLRASVQIHGLEGREVREGRVGEGAFMTFDGLRSHWFGSLLTICRLHLVESICERHRRGASREN